jgi:hypothetical protein
MEIALSALQQLRRAGVADTRLDRFRRHSADSDKTPE